MKATKSAAKVATAQDKIRRGVPKTSLWGQVKRFGSKGAAAPGKAVKGVVKKVKSWTGSGTKKSDIVIGGQRKGAVPVKQQEWVRATANRGATTATQTSSAAQKGTQLPSSLTKAVSTAKKVVDKVDDSLEQMALFYQKYFQVSI